MSDVVDELSTLDNWQEFFLPVGRFVIAFSKLEYAIASCLERVLELNRDQINIIDSRLESVDEMKELLKRSVRLLGENNAANVSLTKILPPITHAINYRNKIMHGRWYAQEWSNDNPDKKSNILNAGKTRTLSCNEIESETRSVVIVVYHLGYWIDQFYGGKKLPPPPSLNKSAQRSRNQHQTGGRNRRERRSPPQSSPA